ncbi:MAG: hypothetical protein OEY67_06705 [Gammaproteobacteria bacterium]|nr:hypothetical protein [Gammaproteobacteria bacterium]
MKKLRAILSILVTMGTLTTAQAADFALGVKGGTLGLGAELTTSIVSNLNVRLGLNSYSYDYTTTESGIDYDAELDLGTTALLLDWHPFSGRFRISAGIMKNDNGINMSATPTTNQIIGGTSYTPAQIGTLTGKIGFKDTAPYVGIGFGNAVSKNKRIGFTLDIGVLIQDSPEVTLSASGGAVSLVDLGAEEAQLESDISEFDVYPVISLGVSYRF